LLEISMPDNLLGLEADLPRVPSVADGKLCPGVS
jgi:hypothetical protein